MAIIKRTPRPGELVRGAAAGNLVAFGPDGEPVDSGKEPADFIELPEGGNVGDVMTKGADGPVWTPPAPLYRHSVEITLGTYIVTFPTIGNVNFSAAKAYVDVLSKKSTSLTWSEFIAACTNDNAVNIIFGGAYTDVEIEGVTVTLLITGYGSGKTIIPTGYETLRSTLFTFFAFNQTTGKIIDTKQYPLYFDNTSTIVDVVTEI